MGALFDRTIGGHRHSGLPLTWRLLLLEKVLMPLLDGAVTVEEERTAYAVW